MSTPGNLVLTESDQRFLAESYDRLRRLPPPKPLVLEPLVQCACRRTVPSSKACRVLTTQRRLQVLDPVCSGCVPKFQDQTRYVCVCCREVIGYTDPERLPNGFELPRSGFVHVSWCQRCHPEEGTAYMLERFFYDARNKRISGLEFNRIRAHIEKVLNNHVHSHTGGSADPRQKNAAEIKVSPGIDAGSQAPANLRPG